MKLELIVPFTIAGVVIAPLIITFIHALISNAKEEREKALANRIEKEKKEREAWERRRVNNFYDKVWNTDWAEDGKPIDIRNIPRLSFDQWLTFYNATPKHWDLTKEQYDGQYCIFPRYKKGKDKIYTFWETPGDLDKFQKWRDNEYQKGDAAVFEQKRAETMSRLAKYIKADIAAQAKQAQKELDELEAEIVKNMPQQDPIQKLFELKRMVEAGTIDRTKLERLESYKMVTEDDLCVTKVIYFYPEYKTKIAEIIIDGQPSAWQIY